MNKTKIWNTKEKGTFEFFIYPDKGRFVGVCLTLNIIEEDDNPQRLLKSLVEAAKGHLEVVRKDNLGDKLLNRYAPKKYWNKYYNVRLLGEAKKIMQKQGIKDSINLPVKQEWAYAC